MAKRLGRRRPRPQAPRQERIPIIGDTPSLVPRLGFETYVSALAAAIQGGTPAQFTIGIYGPWGSGKSSLLNAVSNELASDDNVIPVLFDAWRYEAVSHIVVPLLHAVFRETQALREPSLAEAVRTALLSVVKGITISLGPLSVSGQSLAPSDTGDQVTRLDDAFAKPYAEMRAISEALGGRRIAVLIDDLDRCSSEKLVGLLESINLVMDVPGFIFVLALDYDVLARAVSSKYPYASGHVFIEKMVQVPFRVPRLELPRNGFLSELIPEWEQYTASLPSGFEDIVYDVATLGLEANPRQIKRLINSVLVLLRIAALRAVSVDTRILTGIVGIQLRWPDEYRDFAEAVLADDANPLVAIRPEYVSSLRRYSEHFFSDEVSAEDLRPYLQLTRTVAVGEGLASIRVDDAEVTTVASAAVLRASNKRELVSSLVAQGYEESEISDVYALSRNPDFRVRFGKTVVRFEVRGEEGRWFGSSYLLTKDYPRSLRLVERPRDLVWSIVSDHSTGFHTKISPKWAEQLQVRNADLRRSEAEEP